MPETDTMTENYRCKCGERVTVPTAEAISRVFRDCGFEGEVTLKQKCPNCQRQRFTSYQTGNGHKPIENRS
jgi:hypothetical protein